MGQVDLAIVGAGPYGLSVAAHARHAGLSTAVFGETMSSWRCHMPAGMHLETEGFGSNLSDPSGGWTLAAYLESEEAEGAGHDHQPTGRPVPAATFVEYAAWFARRAGIDPDGRQVRSLTPTATGHQVHLDDGDEVRASSAVVALGLSAFPVLAPALRPLPSTHVRHASQLTRLADLAGRRVAVVGGGQSALETAALVAEAGGQVTLLVRKPAVRWHAPAPAVRTVGQRVRAPRSPLGDGWLGVLFAHGSPLVRHLPAPVRERLGDACFAPAGAWWLRDRVASGVEVRTGTEVASAAVDGEHVALDLRSAAGHEQIVVDHVISAIGYHPDLDRLPLTIDGPTPRCVPGTASPALSARFESSTAGLCFTGALAVATFGRGQTFLAGIPVAARRVAQVAVRRAGTPGA